MQQILRTPRFLSTAARRDLAGLMALYEENYIRLRTLLPGLDCMPDCAVSHVPGAVDLHAEIIERAPYTTSLRLTYCFAESGGTRREPDLLVRICHDARTAEVVDIHRQRGRYRFDARRTLRRSWERNRFLHKWLGYCLRRGHRFEAVPTGFGLVAEA